MGKINNKIEKQITAKHPGKREHVWKTKETMSGKQEKKSRKQKRRRVGNKREEEWETKEKKSG